MAKLPSFQFYPGDWLRDDVAGCSLEAQGLWLRMLIVMHDADTYGYLSINGSPMDSAMVARRCGCSLKQYEAVLAELDAAGIPSRTETGIIFSRRMVRDAEERANNAERQRKFKAKQGSNGGSNGKVTPQSQKSNASSSPSTSKKKEATSVASKKESTHAQKIPDDFDLSDEMRTWAIEQKIGLDLDFETEKFKNYYGALSEANPKSSSDDWVKVWKYWVLSGWEREIKQEANPTNGKKLTNAEIYDSYGYYN